MYIIIIITQKIKKERITASKIYLKDTTLQAKRGCCCGAMLTLEFLEGAIQDGEELVGMLGHVDELRTQAD